MTKLTGLRKPCVCGSLQSPGECPSCSAPWEVGYLQLDSDSHTQDAEETDVRVLSSKTKLREDTASRKIEGADKRLLSISLPGKLTSSTKGSWGKG